MSLSVQVTVMPYGRVIFDVLLVLVSVGILGLVLCWDFCGFHYLGLCVLRPLQCFCTSQVPIVGVRGILFYKKVRRELLNSF